jgi:hypothetical protein
LINIALDVFWIRAEGLVLRKSLEEENHNPVLLRIILLELL